MSRIITRTLKHNDVRYKISMVSRGWSGTGTPIVYKRKWWGWKAVYEGKSDVITGALHSVWEKATIEEFLAWYDETWKSFIRYNKSWDGE